jgi:hypothetical protein
MTPVSAAVYALLIAAVLFSVFSLNDDSTERSATMAPDLHLSTRP